VQDLSTEAKAVKAAAAAFSSFLQSQFQRSRPNNEKLLKDKTRGYHEHFAIIYRLERQRILEKQIELTNVLLIILERLKRQEPLLKAVGRVLTLEPTEDSYQRNRIMLKGYISRL